MRKYGALFLIILHLFSCNYRYNVSSSRNTNVCKKLSGNLVLYAIFVDNDYTKPWTKFDIESTLDSVKNAISWIEQMAEENHISLKIKLDYPIVGDSVMRVERKLPRRSVFASVFSQNGPRNLKRWSDEIAKKVYEQTGASDIAKGSKERLIAYVRNKEKTESVGLMYFVNNYYKNDLSVCIRYPDDVEYCIVSYKYPVVIAHEFLHLFGASDLYRQLYQKQRNKRLALKYFPNDIMLKTEDRSLESESIGELEKYLIGWQDTINPKYNNLLVEKYRKYTVRVISSHKSK